MLFKPKHKPKHPTTQTSHIPYGKLITTLLLTLLASTFAAATALTLNVEGAINTGNATDLITQPRPQKPTPNPTEKPTPHTPNLIDPYPNQPLNILLIGSDIRDGENAKYGNFEGMRSDATILLHISADRKHTEAISIPRDSWVNIPTCTRSDGTTTFPSHPTKFNAAFAYGGLNGDPHSAAACTIQLIEGLTNVYIDEYVILDFTNLKDVIDTLGGVTIDVPHDINAPKADLVITQGTHHIDGKTALGYARARSGEGLNGSDLGRIERQQQLMGAIFTELKKSLTSPHKIYGFTVETAKSLTTSENLGSVTTIAGLGVSLMDTEITFLTVPVVDRGDRANVVWTAEADTLWERIRNDLPPTTEAD